MNKKHKTDDEILNNLLSFRISKKQLANLNALKKEQYVNLSAVFRMCLDKAIEEIQAKK